MRPLASFTPDERAVIRERHLGCEQAPFALLARVFDAHTNTIRTICAGPRNPGRGREPNDPAPSIQQPRNDGPDGLRAVGSFSFHDLTDNIGGAQDNDR